MKHNPKDIPYYPERLRELARTVRNEADAASRESAMHTPGELSEIAEILDGLAKAIEAANPATSQKD